MNISNRLRLIIFDWDGTLVDSVGKIIECKQQIAKKHSLPIPKASKIKQVLGIKFEKALSLCFPTVSTAVLRQIGDEFHTLMQQDVYQSSLFINARKALNMLKVDGIGLIIATSKSRQELDKSILYNKLTDMFVGTYCSEEFLAKPNPAMLHHIMDQYKVKSSECLMIGDTTTDIKFATNAGIKAVCVTFGAHSAKKLSSMAPLALIDDWAQLPDVINKLDKSQLWI